MEPMVLKGHEERKQLFLINYTVYCFNFSTGNQCLQSYIQISAHWPPFNWPALLYHSKMVFLVLNQVYY